MPRIRRADVPPLARDLPPAAPGRPADVICVVVPARDASATLPALLDALAAQTLAPDEVVVVDDGSADGTARVAAAAGVRVVASGRVGPGPARNLGAAATTAPLIAFTDADCAPAPDWLERGVAALGRLDLVQGRVTPPPGVPVGRYDRTVWVDRPSPLFETANLLVRRPAFEAVGGFPPIDALGLPAGEKSIGEDTLFGWSARRSGARVGFAPDVVVHHWVFPRSAREFVLERRRLRFFPALVREVPELRRALPRGVFLTRRAATFDLALLGIALAAGTRRPSPLVAAVPYLRTVRSPAHLAADVVGLLSLLEGSVRCRRVIV